MKRLFFVITLVVICCSCGSSTKGSCLKPEPPKRQGWDLFGLYGDVESVVITSYELKEKFGEVVRGDMESYVRYYFNEAGDVIEVASYDSDGSLDEKNIYKYDSAGNRIEGAYYDSDGSLDWKLTCKYDSAGNCIEEAYYNSNGSLDEKYICKYDSAGNRIEEAAYSGESLIPESQIVYEITYRK